MEALAEAAGRADFAILIATPDDTLESRGATQSVARDNVIFELGLFIGALGRTRTYIVADRTRDLQLPSDLLGLTWLPYKRRPDGNQHAAVNDAVVGILERIRTLGSRTAEAGGLRVWDPSDQHQTLVVEIERICSAARAQGWRVRTNSDTTLRLEDRRRRKFTLSIEDPTSTRVALRSFAAELRGNGLRLSRSVRRPVGDEPLPR